MLLNPPLVMGKFLTRGETTIRFVWTTDRNGAESGHCCMFGEWSTLCHQQPFTQF